MTIKIGVPLGSMDNTGTSNEDKGLWLEYGTPTAPPRPWLTRAKDAVMADKELLGRMLLSPEAGAQEALEVMRAQFEGEYMPLATSTLAARRRKGNSSQQPTIDTGQLRDSLSYQVVLDD
ncbi:MAG: hypothetical protein NC548_32320 [Lachnospiraceae bacterium]|nr:hypothetical protein [Lachnospiraceae bacterium]